MPVLTPNLGLFKPLVNDPTDQDLWGGYLNENMDTLDTAVPNATPTGTVAPFSANTIPTGWLLCSGQAVSRSTYSALFALYNTDGLPYGTGDGTSTFNVPDLRGRLPAGVDNMGGTAANRITNGHAGITGTTLGAAGGNEQLHQHTHTTNVTDPGHRHGWNATMSVNTNNNQMALGQGGGNGPISAQTGFTTTVTTGITVSNNTAGGGASENVQPTMMLNYIVKT